MPTVLVIDDNPSVAIALEMLFSLHDIDTRAVTSPEEGLTALDRADFDLVVQDMNFRADTTSGEEAWRCSGRSARGSRTCRSSC